MKPVSFSRTIFVIFCVHFRSSVSTSQRRMGIGSALKMALSGHRVAKKLRTEQLSYASFVSRCLHVSRRCCNFLNLRDERPRSPPADESWLLRRLVVTIYLHGYDLNAILPSE